MNARWTEWVTAWNWSNCGTGLAELVRFRAWTSNRNAFGTPSDAGSWMKYIPTEKYFWRHCQNHHRGNQKGHWLAAAVENGSGPNYPRVPHTIFIRWHELLFQIRFSISYINVPSVVVTVTVAIIGAMLLLLGFSFQQKKGGLKPIFHGSTERRVETILRADIAPSTVFFKHCKLLAKIFQNLIKNVSCMFARAPPNSKVDSLVVWMTKYQNIFPTTPINPNSRLVRDLS